MAHYDPETPRTIAYEDIPLYAFLDRTASRNPHGAAIRFQNYTQRYAALQRQAERAAAGLAALGVQPGDRVALMLPNLPQTIVAFWAVLKAGAVVVMINPLSMARELTHQLGDSGARVLVTLPQLCEKVSALGDAVPLERIVLTSVADGLAPPKSWLYTLLRRREGAAGPACDGDRLVTWTRLVRTRRREPGLVTDPGEALACLQYTGGTTGNPKGAMLTHANLTANVQQCLAVLHGLEPEGESFLGLLPYFHVFGLTVCMVLPTAIGATMLPFPRYSPADILQTIHRRRPTVFPGAPSVYISLMRQKNLAQYDLSRLQYAVSGSAPMPVEALTRFESLTGARIVEGYGLTEASPVTHLNPLRGVRKVGSIGLPFPDTACRIRHLETGEDLPPGQAGELWLRGPQVMRGYWNQPEETAAVLQDGWLATGDIAVMDEEGYFRIVDRKKDLILAGGFNVYPREVEETLQEHPAVKEAAVVGRAHATRGETVHAFVVLEDGIAPESAPVGELVRWCRARLANYKIPRAIEVVESLPKSVVGKLLRRELKK